MSNVNVINGTLKSNTLMHVTAGRNPVVSFEGIPVVPFFVVEKQLIDEYKKWGLPLPTELNKGVSLIKKIIGSKIPISSLYPKLKSEVECFEVVVGKVENKAGFGGNFRFDIPVNYDAPIEEFDALFGCLKSLGDLGVGGDRTYGFGDGSISINAVNSRPIRKKGLFVDLWDEEFIKPLPLIPRRLGLSEKVKYSQKLMKWVTTRGVDWMDTSIKYLVRGESVVLPKVECRAFIDYSVVDGRGELDMKVCSLLRKECRNEWRSLGRQAIRYFGGRVYHSVDEYTPYESMVKFKPGKIVVEGSEEDVRELVDFITSTLDGRFVTLKRLKAEYGVSIDGVKFKDRMSYFKLDHWCEG